MCRAAWKTRPASRVPTRSRNSWPPRVVAALEYRMNSMNPTDAIRQLLADELAGKFPDARGRFGPFGGRYVPETLVAAFERLEAGMRQHLHAAGLPGRAHARAQELGRPSHGAHARAQAFEGLGRGGVAQARGPRAHRRAQDQQRARPGAAREAARRETHRRRDRRRPAWRRERRGLRARRAALHGVHGRGRHGAPGAERRAA